MKTSKRYAYSGPSSPEQIAIAQAVNNQRRRVAWLDRLETELLEEMIMDYDYQKESWEGSRMIALVMIAAGIIGIAAALAWVML